MTYEPQKGLSHARMYRTRKTRGAVRSQPDSHVVMLGVWPVPDSRPATACNVAPVPVAWGQRPSEKILAKPMAVGLGRPRPWACLHTQGGKGRGTHRGLLQSGLLPTALCRQEAASAVEGAVRQRPLEKGGRRRNFKYVLSGPVHSFSFLTFSSYY